MEVDPHTRPVSVVVTACEDSSALRACLERVARQGRLISAEVLLVCNVEEAEFSESSRRELSALVTRVLFEPEPGKSNALNSAVLAAQGHVIAFTDDDALPDEGWLEAITAPLLSDDTLTGCGGPVLPVFPPGGPPDWLRHLMGRTRSTFLGPYHFLGNEELAYGESDFGSGLPFGASCAFRRQALLDHPYRPELGPNRVTGLQGGEDTEFALHLLRTGHRLRYVPAARVHHPVHPDRMTLDWLERRHRTLGRETVLIQRALGEEVPDADLLREHIRTCEGRGLRKLLRKPRHKFRRRLRRISLEGSLEEVLSW